MLPQQVEKIAESLDSGWFQQLDVIWSLGAMQRGIPSKLSTTADS
jgi:hypothetical protein